jgi:RHS repeat-associated protein
MLGLVSETDVSGNALSVDANGVHSFLGPASSPTAGPSITLTRDSQGRITDINGPVTGQHYHYAYFPSANELQAVTNPMGNTVAYSYDPQSGNLQKSLDPNNQPIQALIYDAAGRLVSIANGNQPATSITTSVAAQQQVILDPNGKLTTVLSYDALGSVTERGDTFGGKTLKTTYTYDAVGRLTSVTDPLKSTTAVTYDPITGDAINVSSSGRTWGLENYNKFGEPGLIRKPDGTVDATFAYDAKTGALLTKQQPGANPTTLTYLLGGQLKSVSDPGGRSLSYTYDANGNLATISDSQGRTIKVSIDTTGKVRSVTDQLGNLTTFDFNPDGTQQRMTDASQHQWQYSYDALGRTRQVTDPLQHSATFLYNDLGELQQGTDRNGQVTTYAYDVDGLVSKETRPGNDIVNFVYDPLGRLVQTDNASGHIDRTYDDVSRPVAETTCANTGAPSTPCSAAPPGNQPTVALTYAYFPDSQLKSVTSSDPGTPTVQYGYDNLGRLASIQYGNQAAFTFGYDSFGRPNSLGRPNGVSDTFGYNASGELTARDATLNGTTIARFDYGIDPVTGRRISMTDNSGTTNYSYFDSGWLRSASHPAGSGIPNESYTYDPAGNRSSGAISSSYDAADRIQSDGTYAYVFDGEGNLKTKTLLTGGPGTTYSWNADHQLLGITYPDGTTSSFRYDPFGRRVSATNKGQESRFVYNGLSVQADYTSANQVQTSYLSGLEAVASNGSPAYYLSDGLGSVRALTNSAGAISGSYSYDSFGIPAASNPTTPTRDTFTGYQYDSTSGLYDAGARYYDPAVGRFLSEDPITSVNPFPYAANDPVNSVDVNGLQAVGEYSILLQTDVNNAQCISGAVGAIAIPSLFAAGLGLEGNAVPSEDVIASIGLALTVNGAVCAANALTTNPCSFKITGWKGYPGWAQRPTGWLRPISGAEYTAARNAANSANRATRNASGGALKGYEVHEWQTVKFGGSPRDIANKGALPIAMHRELSGWWYGLQLYLQALGC